ncbi:MAG: hypothetical protein GY796_30100, partial [Chloroflexi bacterium]|nr:hypothetical protein [Chloroflexota bacterium]
HAKDEFVSNVSHELRTPLSVLTLASDNLDQLYDRLDDAQRRKMIRKIQKHTQILNEIISDVLDISRIDSRRVSLQREAVDLVQIAQAEVQELLPLASEKSQTLQQATSVEQLNVLGHPVQLRQVIRNLLNNAIKYTPDGGEIRCECALISDQLGVNGPRDETGWPESANLPGGPWTALRVGDTGLGISAEHLPHLFSRFYRVETQQKIRGTGLGLAIARKLIELHGGHIAVASVPNQGSTFAIYLPLLTETITQSGVK